MRTGKQMMYHSVHIIGIAKDEKGNKYYKIKDSAPKKDCPYSPVYFSENFPSKSFIGYAA